MTTLTWPGRFGGRASFCPVGRLDRRRQSCKSILHELVWTHRWRFGAPWLSPRQPARSPDRGGVGVGRRQGAGRLHHFRDAEALLAEVAVRGFERFAERLTKAWNGGRPDAVRAFEDLGRAYLAFAREEPAYYAAMFESRIAQEAHPGLQAAGDRAFGVLREGADHVAATLPKERRPPSLMMALHVWAMAHGIASLFVREGPSRRKLPMPAEDLLEAGVLIYLQSLGLAGGE
jgi:AcrR family transcriptional regulator